MRSVQLVRRPLEDGSGFSVTLVDQGGAKYNGDIAGTVGWKTGSTVTFVGTVVILPCSEAGGPAPISIVGTGLTFTLEADGRLTHTGGSGTVTRGSTKVSLRAPRATTSKK